MSTTRTNNYAAHARVREAAADGGAKDIEVFVEDYINYKVDAEPAELKAWVARMREEKPHRWGVGGGVDMDAEALATFGPNGTSLTKRADFARKYGTETANQISREFNTTVASTRPGIVPERLKAKVAETAPKGDNPWAAEGNVSGPGRRFTSAAIAKQMNLVRTLCAAHGQKEGERRAAAIAAAAGCQLGDLRAAFNG
jgi:hypothetical protein